MAFISVGGKRAARAEAGILGAPRIGDPSGALQSCKSRAARHAPGPMPRKSAKPEKDAAEEPHYHGHRERLRERFFSAGPMR